MTRKLAVSATIALWLMTNPNPAFAQYQSGNRLYEDCRSEEGDFKSGLCLGYITAVADAHLETVFTMAVANIQRQDVQLRTSFCLRKQVNIGQLRDVVFQYLQRNPSERDKTAASLVIEALAQAFPCPNR